MGLSARERHVLDAIERKLANSDPSLTSMLARFNRLAAGQALPAWEKIHIARRWATSRPRRGREHRRTGGVMRWQLVWWLVWFAVSAALIVVVLSLGERGPGTGCAGWAPVCATRAHPHPPPGVHLR